MRLRFFSLLFLFSIFMLPQAHAEDPGFASLQHQMQEMRQMIQGLQSTIQTQNGLIQRQNLRIEKLEIGGVVPQNIPVPQTQGTSLMGRAASAVGVSQGFNPDIGVVGIVQAKLTQSPEDADGNDTIALKEIELNFAHVVDAYSRFDAVIALNDALEEQNVEIEEGYYTHWGLPFGFLGQIGKFRSKIGKQNLLHGEQLDTVDYPLVIQDFFGDEGLASSGVRLQHLIPNPLDIPLEITGEVLRGNNGNSFSGISRRPIFNTHVKSFFEITKDANVELGWTTMFGDENPPISQLDEAGNRIFAPSERGQDRYGVKVFGGDVTYNWLLPEERKIKWQSELFFQNRTDLVHPNDNPWGFYSLVDYRFSKSFSVGVRFDYVEPLDVDGFRHKTTGISPYLTFWQSEFADFRLQYSYLHPADPGEKIDNAIYLKANFLIGAHKHPIQ